MSRPGTTGRGEPSEPVDHHDPAPRIVVLDVGEVLIDETRVWQVWADLVGTSAATFAAVLGAAISQGQDHRSVLPLLAPNLAWEELAGEHEERYGGFREDDLYTDARPCIAELTAAGFTVVVAGNQPAQRTAQLEALALGVDDVVTSAELGAEKPDPAFFAALQERIGVDDPADVLYVGDRVDNDVVASLGAGMQSCWLRRGPWGVLQELPDDVEPAIVLEGLGELPTLLTVWRDG